MLSMNSGVLSMNSGVLSMNSGVLSMNSGVPSMNSGVLSMNSDHLSYTLYIQSIDPSCSRTTLPVPHTSLQGHCTIVNNHT